MLRPTLFCVCKRGNPTALSQNSAQRNSSLLNEVEKDLTEPVTAWELTGNDQAQQA